MQRGYILSLPALLIFLALMIRGPLEELPSEVPCELMPLCSSPYLTWKGFLWCQWRKFPYPLNSEDYRKYVRTRLRQVEKYFVLGQPSISAIVQSIEEKIRCPDTITVLSFTGDNGVGKTRTAEAISLALGHRYSTAGSGRTYGDTTFVISGSSYKGKTREEFYHLVVKKLMEHTLRYPLLGVVVINEADTLPEPAKELLYPLLSGEAFPAAPNIALNRLIVLLTTDFSVEGKTRNRSPFKIEELAEKHIRKSFPLNALHHIRSHAFLPVEIDTAIAIIRNEIRIFGCRRGVKFAVSDDVVRFLLEKVKESLATENGREIHITISQFLEDRFLRETEVNHPSELTFALDQSYDEYTFS